MSYHSRRILPPGASRKRKDREAFGSTTSSKPVAPQKARAAEQQPLASNRLLAGYMAYEFLTKGTLFGQKFDPARAEAVPVNSADSKKNRQSYSQSQVQPSTEAEPSGKSTAHGYADVAHVLKSDGAHIPGVVNPTQLARWIQM